MKHIIKTTLLAVSVMVIFTACSKKLPEIGIEQIKKDLSGELFRSNPASRAIEIEEKDILEVTVEGTKIDKESKTAEKIVKFQAQKKEANPYMADYELALFKIETNFKLNYSYYDTGWKLENKMYDNVQIEERKTGEYLPLPEYKLNNTELKNLLETPDDLGSQYYIRAVDDTYKTATFQKGTIKSLEILDIKDDLKEGKRNIKVKVEFESKPEEYISKVYKGKGTALIEIPYSHIEGKWVLTALRVEADKDMVWE